MTRPNILVFLTDDHAQWATGHTGSADLQTPALDFLAETGVRMANAFTPCPVCSPARACFWTGRLPSQHGIHDWLHEKENSHDWMAAETNLAQYLQAAGYETALVGKWHCGRSHLPQPGFEHYFSYERGQYPHYGNLGFVRDGVALRRAGYQTPFLTEEAIAFLRGRDRSRPFFLFVGYVDTHSPFRSHPERFVRPYRRAAFADVPQEDFAGSGWIRFGVPESGEERQEWLAQYAAAVTFVDVQAGAVLDALEGQSDLDNTLVVYTSDHGHMNGQHGLYTKGNATVPQNFYEEAIRVPLLLRWPGRLWAGATCTEMVDHCDLFQTLLEAASAPLTAEQQRARNPAGASFLSLAAGATMPWRSLQFCEYGNARMVRTERYKLVCRYAPHDIYGDELFDLAQDPREKVNRIGEESLVPVIALLRESLESHFARFSEEGQGGTDILRLPVQNHFEPWRLSKPAPSELPANGSDMALLRPPLTAEERGRVGYTTRLTGGAF